jgi:hypothetical protein
MNILGIYGKAGSGKSTTVALLKDKYGFVVIHFDDALHQEASFPSSIPAHGTRETDGNFLQQWRTIRPNRLEKDCRIERVKTALANLKAKGVRNVVIADTRFVGEANFIKSIGGKLMRIVRYDINGNQYIVPKSDPNYESETALDDYQEFDALLINVFDIKFVHDSAEEILFKLFPDIA